MDLQKLLNIKKNKKIILEPVPLEIPIYISWSNFESRLIYIRKILASKELFIKLR